MMANVYVLLDPILVLSRLQEGMSLGTFSWSCYLQKSTRFHACLLPSPSESWPKERWGKIVKGNVQMSTQFIKMAFERTH